MNPSSPDFAYRISGGDLPMTGFSIVDTFIVAFVVVLAGIVLFLSGYEWFHRDDSNPD